MKAIQSVSHVTIAAPDAAAAAQDYERLLGMRATSDGGDYVFLTGNIALRLRTCAVSEAAGLSALAFRVVDLTRACDELARCGLSSDKTLGDNVVLDKTGTHGLPIALTSSGGPKGSATDLSLDHIVIRTPDPERAVALYGGRLGLDMRLDRSNPAWNARLMFFRCGDLVVEIAHVLSDGVSDAPDTFGGLSWRVPDIDATHARLLGEGFALSEVRKGRRPGSRVCTVRTRTAGVPTILLGVTPRTV